MNSNWFKLFLKIRKIRYGKKLKLRGSPFVYNSKGSSIVIGDNVTVNSSFLSNLVGLYCKTIIVTRTPNATIKIGNNVGISGATIYARKSIEIGDYTLIGGNAKILDNDFHPLDPQARADDDKESIQAKPIIIGKNCFIGCNAIILKGTILGDNCIVGAGAVVSGIFEANSIIAGNPAKVIRSLNK